MLRKKTRCLVLMLLIVRFSTAFPQDNQDGLAFYLDEFESFATVGQVFAGPISDSHGVTSLQVTNRDTDKCEVGILFHKGVFIPDDFPVMINGEQGVFTSETISPGGVKRFDVTADEFVQGVVALGFRTLAPECDAKSFSVTATSLAFTNPLTTVTVRVQGVEPREDLSEAFSITVNDADTWLCSGFCWAISTTQGVGPASVRQRLAMAVSSVVPGQAAPEGTQLRFFSYDGEGTRIATGVSDVDGSHTAFFPRQRVLDFDGEVTLIICLRSLDPDYKMDLTVIRVNQIRDGTVQYDRVIFADGFESGDVSAWGIVESEDPTIN